MGKLIRSIRSRQLFFRNAIAFLVVFTIPLATFSLGAYRASSRIFREQYVSTVQKVAHNVNSDIAHTMELALNTANHLRSNRYFSDVYIRKTAGAFHYIDETMAYVNGLNFGKFEAGFYSSATDLIYGGSINDRAFYFDHFFLSQALTAQTDLKQILVPRWIPMEEVTFFEKPTCISTLIVPVEVRLDGSRRAARSSLICHFTPDQIRHLLSPLRKNETTRVVVFYRGEPILADSMESLELARLQPLSPGLPEPVSWKGSSYLPVWDGTGDGFSVLTLLDQADVRAYSSSLLSLYLTSLGISTAIGLLLLMLGLINNYQPINRMMKKVLPLSGNLPPELRQTDELSRTSYVLDNLVEDRRKLTDARHQMELTHTLLRLLENSGSYVKKPSLGGHLRNLNLDLSANFYCCVILSRCSKTRDLLQKLSSLVLPGKNFLLCTGEVDDDGIIALFGLEENGLQLPMTVLSKYTGQYTRAGVGNPVSRLEDVTASYRQAYRAILHSDSPGAIQLYSQLPPLAERDIMVQFTRETEYFQSALIQKQCSRMLLALRHIAELLDLVSSMDAARMMLHHLLAMAVKSLAVLNLPYTPTVNQFANLADCSAASEVSAWIRAFAEHLSGILTRVPPDASAGKVQGTPVIKDIQYALMYINSNYASPSFSIKQLADEMGMSLSNLSHFFKGRTGQNLSDYISELRISRAKELLTYTDLKVSEIYPQLGFTHASSFSKSFKASTGMTPSEFKAAAKQKKRP